MATGSTRSRTRKVPPDTAPSGVDKTELRAVVGKLAGIHRPSASEGERDAAEWIAKSFQDLGCTVAIEEEASTGGYWWSVGTMSAASVLAGLLAIRSQKRRRKKGTSSFGLGRVLGVVVGGLCAVGLADDVTAGPMRFRHTFLSFRSTWNVLAETGEPEADRTLVILGHHDAAHSGLLFHPAIPKWMYENFPDRVERSRESLPYWFPVVGAPILVAIGSLISHSLGQLITRIGVGLGLGVTVLVTDIGMRDAVPGANDNLSATAVQVHIARALRQRPIHGLRVLLVSCGSEETLQEGIIAFAKRHFPELPPDRTDFLTLDTVGSPRLILVEAEGTLRMRPYSPELNALIADTAAANGIDLIRGMRARSSTDGCVPQRHGYPTALLASFNKYKALSNYHWPTDTAENVDYDTVANCASLTEAVIRRMAAEA